MLKHIIPTSSLRTLIILVAALMLGTGITVLSTNKKQINLQPVPTPANKVFPTSSANDNPENLYVVYGYNANSSTYIFAKNPTSSQKIFAILPDKIKHINFLSATEVIYIAGLDEKDHGRSIMKYNNVEGTSVTLYQSPADWGIDNIIVSPDRQYIAWWEVKMASPNALLDGNSRVYAKRINPDNNPVLIADEIALSDSPVHYPMFFDNSNKLYLDSFIPNGGGFYLGLYQAEPDNPFSLTEITEMKTGDYLSDPELSPDGTKILFTSNNRSVTDPILAGSPNQITLLDLATRIKTDIVKSESNQFINPKWSTDGSKIAYSAYQFQRLQPTPLAYQGIYLTDPNGSTPKLLYIQNITDASILDFIENNLIWGKTTQDMGNLGKNYSFMLSEINFTDVESESMINLAAGQFIQYLTSTNYPLNLEGSDETIKLAQFSPNSVPPERKAQQNLPVPVTSGMPVRPTPPNQNAPRCREICGDPNSTAGWMQCIMQNFLQGKCYDSPLYLYPEKETEVKISVTNAKVFSETPKSDKGTWKVTAYPDGTILAGQYFFDKITFGYLGSPQPPPDYGLVVPGNELEKTLIFFAQNLSLSNQEVTDFVSFWKDYLPDSPYYLISFYPDEVVKKIISYSFDPQPETFIQVIMYFKPLKNPVSVPSPVFKPVERKGFTAVDWSGIVDQVAM